MFSVKVAKPVPLKAPSVDAIRVALDVELEFGLPDVLLPDVVLPEEVFSGGVLVGEDVALDEKAFISYIRMIDLL